MFDTLQRRNNSHFLIFIWAFFTSMFSASSAAAAGASVGGEEAAAAPCLDAGRRRHGGGGGGGASVVVRVVPYERRASQRVRVARAQGPRRARHLPRPLPLHVPLLRRHRPRRPHHQVDTSPSTHACFSSPRLLAVFENAHFTFFSRFHKNVTFYTFFLK